MKEINPNIETYIENTIRKGTKKDLEKALQLINHWKEYGYETRHLEAIYETYKTEHKIK